MKQPATQPTDERPWRMPLLLREVPESGRHVELTADQSVRNAIARTAGLRDLPRLAATFEVSRRGDDGLRVVGQLSATVGQVCVVTLEPIENAIEEAIDLSFVPAPAGVADVAAEAQVRIGSRDGPEPLVNGAVDLGALATEFLMLAIDPYPRKPGAVFEGPKVPDERGQAFAALAALKKAQDDNRG